MIAVLTCQVIFQVEVVVVLPSRFCPRWHGGCVDMLSIVPSGDGACLDMPDVVPGGSVVCVAMPGVVPTGGCGCVAMPSVVSGGRGVCVDMCFVSLVVVVHYAWIKSLTWPHHGGHHGHDHATRRLQSHNFSTQVYQVWCISQMPPLLQCITTVSMSKAFQKAFQNISSMLALYSFIVRIHCVTTTASSSAIS